MSLLFCSWLGIVSGLQAQPVSIMGQVLEMETREPLQGANVFLASSTYGASTDSLGTYSIVGIQPGVYTLVFSMLGFEVQRKEIRLFPGDKLDRMDAALEFTAYELDGVEVTGEMDKKWARRFKRFEELIIGSSERAKRTRLLNREVVDLNVDAAGRMTASSHVPLRIHNEALGYRIMYSMQDFIMDPQARIMRYQGEPFFEEMDPASDEESRMWEARRREAYLGSMGHLFSAIIGGTTFEEQFQLYEGDREEPVGSNELLVETESGEYKMAFKNPLKVIYTRRPNRADRKFSLVSQRIHEEISFLYLHVPAVTINPDGYYTPSEALTATGSLGDRRLADLVPRDYSTR
ncbi:MAG: carboxypeptidase-like regulatory domain-containing protein [Rhodothermaceae bacterium]|nr:carboxypeptidase-like regulatory domain-containing protein [Rhodothermaceae bacterium]